MLGTDGGELCIKVPALLLRSCVELDKILSFKHILKQVVSLINYNLEGNELK